MLQEDMVIQVFMVKVALLDAMAKMVTQDCQVITDLKGLRALLVKQGQLAFQELPVSVVK